MVQYWRVQILQHEHIWSSWSWDWRRTLSVYKTTRMTDILSGSLLTCFPQQSMLSMHIDVCDASHSTLKAHCICGSFTATRASRYLEFRSFWRHFPTFIFHPSSRSVLASLSCPNHVLPCATPISSQTQPHLGLLLLALLTGQFLPERRSLSAARLRLCLSQLPGLFHLHRMVGVGTDGVALARHMRVHKWML